MSARTSPYKRARAARLIREGKTYAEAGRAIGRDRRTITRWMGDESFLNMLHAHGVLSAGPLRVRAAVDDVLHDLPSEESWLWVSVPDASVLGSLVVDDATHLRVAFVPPERVPFVRGELEQKRFPVLAGERTTVLVPEALGALQEQEALELLVRLGSADPAEAFRAFLSLWRFRAQETMDIRLLGEGLWPAQELFIQEIASHPHVYALKARKLGQSTIACAYDAFVLRFRDQNARVHLFSRGERVRLRPPARHRGLSPSGSRGSRLAGLAALHGWGRARAWSCRYRPGSLQPCGFGGLIARAGELLAASTGLRWTMSSGGRSVGHSGGTLGAIEQLNVPSAARAARCSLPGDGAEQTGSGRSDSRLPRAPA